MQVLAIVVNVMLLNSIGVCTLKKLFGDDPAFEKPVKFKLHDNFKQNINKLNMNDDVIVLHLFVFVN